MKSSPLWISPDGLFLVVLTQVTSVSFAIRNGIQVRSGAHSVVLDEANGKDFMAALLRFHGHGSPPPKPNISKK